MKNTTVRFLRWSERYTKTDMVYLMKNSGWVFLGQMATSLSAFVVMVALANLVNKAEYGEYRFVISMILILSISTLPGMNTSLVQATARGKTGQLPTTTRVRIKWGLIGSLASLTIAGYYYFNNNTSLTISFATVAMFLPFYNSFFGYYFYLQGKQLFNQAALVQGISRIVFLAGMLAVAYLAPTAPYLIAMYMTVTLVMQYAGYRWTTKYHPEVNRDSTETSNYGKYLSAWQLPHLFAAQIGTIATWFFLGDIEAAIYAVAMMIPMEMNRFGAILNQVAMPKMASKGIDISALFKKIIKLEIVFLAVWALYGITAPYIFQTFFPLYPEAVTYSIIAMAIILLIPRLVLHALVNAKKMKKIINRAYIVVPLTQVFLTLILIPYFGIWGAVFASVLSWAFDYLLLIYFLIKEKGTQI